MLLNVRQASKFFVNMYTCTTYKDRVRTIHANEEDEYLRKKKEQGEKEVWCCRFASVADGEQQDRAVIFSIFLVYLKY